MAAAPRVLDRLRRGEADCDAHRTPSVGTASVGIADSNSGCPRAARSAAAYRYDARCDGPDDANAKAIGPLIRLDNERSPVQERLEPLGAGSDIGVWRGHPCRLENPGGDDLVA